MARVLLVEQGGRGGVTDYVKALAGGLAGAGWEVEVASATDHTWEPAEGVRVHRVFFYLRERGPVSRLVRRLRLSKVVNGVAQALAMPRLTVLARRCDVAHVQGIQLEPLGVLELLALRLARTPVVYTPHNTFHRGRQWRRSHAAIDRLSSAIVLHAEWDRDRLPERVRDRAVVIPHGGYESLARPADREAARAELGAGAAEVVVLLFGQLRADKGIGDLAEAAVQAEDVRVLLAGQDAGGLAAARGSLDALRATGRLTLREGFADALGMAAAFAAADLVALPYPTASASGVLMLAYAFARPVAVYPVGGLLEYVRDGETGWVCATPTPDALAAVLSEVTREECARRGEAGSRLAVERFSWTAIAAETTALYARVAT